MSRPGFVTGAKASAAEPGGRHDHQLRRHRDRRRLARRALRRLRAAEGLWGVGDITGLFQFTHVGKYQGEVVAANTRGSALAPPAGR